MDNDIKEVLVSKMEIENICERLGKQLENDYRGKDLVVVGLLSGCLPFMADLVRHINLHLATDYIKVSSYNGGTTSSGHIEIKSDLNIDVSGKNVLIVDDIIDTGLTLKEVVNYFLNIKKAKTVKTCVLLDKKEGRKEKIEADYVGTLVPKKFVVGYGLDYEDFYRNLPYIGVLKEEVYSK
jgi:hypoxanthine phosphoribosyltransferase